MIPEWVVTVTAAGDAERRALLGKLARLLNEEQDRRQAAKQPADEFEAALEQAGRDLEELRQGLARRREQDRREAIAGPPEAGGSPPQPEDPAEQIRRSLLSPVLLDESELPQVGLAGKGDCSECLCPAQPGKDLCWYCARLSELKRQQLKAADQKPELADDRPRRPRKREETAVSIFALAVCLIVAGLYVPYAMGLGFLMVFVAVTVAVRR